MPMKYVSSLVLLSLKILVVVYFFSGTGVPFVYQNF